MQKQCTLRIATYNIWNDDNQNKRADKILQELHAVRADIIGLQEVTGAFYEQFLKENVVYPYSCFYPYSGEEEGLAIISRFPLESESFLHTSANDAFSNALNIVVVRKQLRISITNVHLPWDSVKKQEEQIVAIDKFIHGQEADFFVLLGDFNGNMNSSVNRYLLGDQTINGEESNPYWKDLQSGHCVRKGIPLTPTLDFIKNPRFRGKETISVPMVADRIYVMESWETIDMEEFSVFGTEVYQDTGMCASDHYGIVTELNFKK